MAFDPVAQAVLLEGFSYAEIERVCLSAIKTAVLERRRQVREADFRLAVRDEIRRRSGSARLSPML
ncbi:hypothetical protein BLTE_20910 [Blastochloris tepida]|uniref:AAA ATPase AAA+ lid domain-containing protein n=1 Tax=Blastochloris tepida TaxID=2233851 RepID=A0A348G1H3_9HYPH|nr:hypothetical protein BLTE_20910 [Blastochloris tepida]